MAEALAWMIGFPLMYVAGRFVNKLFQLDGLAKWIAARVPFFNRLPWVEKP